MQQTIYDVTIEPLGTGDYDLFVRHSASGREETRATIPGVHSIHHQRTKDSAAAYLRGYKISGWRRDPRRRNVLHATATRA